MILPIASTIKNFTQYREDEMDCPVPNRNKLVGVRVLPGNEALDVELEEEGELQSVRIDDKRVIVMEFSAIEAVILDSKGIELS